MSAFGQFHKTLSRMKVGEEVEITTERKGNFDRITSINGSGSSGSPPSSGNRSSSGPSTGREEIPISMKVAWAKDLMVSSVAGTPKEAAGLVEDIIKELKALATPANPTP